MKAGLAKASARLVTVSARDGVGSPRADGVAARFCPKRCCPRTVSATLVRVGLPKTVPQDE